MAYKYSNGYATEVEDKRDLKSERAEQMKMFWGKSMDSDPNTITLFQTSPEPPMLPTKRSHYTLTGNTNGIRKLPTLSQSLAVTKQPSWNGSDASSYSSSQQSQSSVSSVNSGIINFSSQPTLLTGFQNNPAGVVDCAPSANGREFTPGAGVSSSPLRSITGGPAQPEPVVVNGQNRIPPGGLLAGDPRWTEYLCVERQAQAYRTAAAGATAAAVWSGVLPPRNTKGSAFSCKVFLGGVPWDITESDLQIAFGKFGNPKIEWPATHDQNNRNAKGHLYLIFDTEKSVKQLLGSCSYDFNHGHHNWYYKVSSARMRVKEVQVIPWQLADASYVRNGCMTTFGTKTVFVGSLHGMLTAEGLAKVLDDLFGGVVAATIDTDKYKYPIGSGRVTFISNESYTNALRAVFVDLRTPKFNKKIQIDPFLEDSACSICNTQVGPYFCRDLQCFNYFCHSCWQWQHSANNIGHHIPLMRNART